MRVQLTTNMPLDLWSAVRIAAERDRASRLDHPPLQVVAATETEGCNDSNMGLMLLFFRFAAQN